MKIFLLVFNILFYSSTIWASSGQNHYLRNAAFVEVTALAGIYASDKYLYPGQDDKRLHARYGLGISSITTAVSLLGAYTISDSTISVKWKERLVGCAGPLMAMLAGATKEVMDSRDPAHHTADINDAIATSVGGGMPLGCVLSFSF